MFTEQMKSAYDTMSPSDLQKARLLTNIELAAKQGKQTNFAFHLHNKKIAFLPLVAIIILVLSSTALAVATLAGAIDWNGNVKNEALPEPTIAPATEKSDNSVANRAMQILAGCAENELWIVRYIAEDGNQSAASIQRFRSFASLDAIKDALASSPVHFALPTHLPDGYLFYEGKLKYECATAYSYTLLGSETTADGLVIGRYKTVPEADVISGYSLLYKNAAGNILRFGADLANSSDEHGFGIMEGDEYAAFAVAGMDDAVYVERPTDSNLYMRQSLPTPIAFRDTFAMLQQSSSDDEISQFDEIHYSVLTNILKAVDMLKSLF